MSQPSLENDTNVNISSARVIFPIDWRDSYERETTETPAGRRERIRNNRALSPTEKAEERLEELLSLPSSAFSAYNQAVVCYVSGSTTVRVSTSLSHLGTGGQILAGLPWVALAFAIAASLKNKHNIIGVAWRLTAFTLGGL